MATGANASEDCEGSEKITGLPFHVSRLTFVVRRET